MASEKDYDVIVIGAGPGGYVCAIRCAQLGFKTACVEKDKTLGGTCLNVGCIPSKALLQASEKYDEAANHLSDMGIKTGKVSVDLKTMMKHKESVVASNTQGIEFLFKKNKIDWLKGTGSVEKKGEVKVGKDTYKAKHIVVATGSAVATLPGIEIDEKQIVSSTGALDLKEVPKSMVLIGGGVIGLEMGAVWSRLGADVTVVEYMDTIMGGMDNGISKDMQKILTKQGMKFKTGAKVTEAKKTKSGVTLKVEPAKGGDSEELKADIVLVAVGRKPYTDKLGLDKVGVDMDDRGRIKTDSHFKTNVDGIYAIGDVIAGPMLAHKAEDEGVVLAEILAGQAGHINYDAIPGVVYTWPEVASVGKTEEQLKEDGRDYKIGKFPFSANGRARAMNMTDGYVKVLADKKTDRLLGVHIIGANAGDLIQEAVTIIEIGGSAEDIARTCHAHPTLGEAVKEAALATQDGPLHM
ncbi:MAG: dihydrolipoyl dehydrogenase [Micavibrio sp.]|nr:dihydrolipoyl dehydrogenase [Micavibrio sp.]HCK33320.1 dihydrolipoyl dehydrogenase [Rhodospirillaceae bacterium]